MRRWAIALGLVLVALASVSAWLARSEAAFAFLARRAEALSGGRVTVEGASGSLLGMLRAERVTLRTGETRSVAERVELAPRWSAFAGGALAFDVEIGRAHV